MKRLTNSEFNPKVPPTLGTQIYKMALQNTDFQIYDLGGQKKLRTNWYSPNLKPQGIVYVIDCSGNNDHFNEAREEFDRVIKYYYENQEFKDRISPPLLILGNKTDLLPQKNEYLLKEIIYEIPDHITVEMKYCSAFTGEGVEDAFKWIVGEIIKIN
jgi:ADP-ribosylation factor protein 1/Arf/Sar family protein